LLLLSLATALAAEPVVTTTTQADGTIVARIEMAASEEAIRAVLEDGATSVRLSDDVLSVEAALKGRCTEMVVKTKGAWNPLKYKALRCPTANGWRTSLMESEDFRALEVEWKLDPSCSDLTTVEYRVRTDVDIAAPKALIQQGVKRSAIDTLKELLRKVVGRKK